MIRPAGRFPPERDLAPDTGAGGSYGGLRQRRRTAMGSAPEEDPRPIPKTGLSPSLSFCSDSNRYTDFTSECTKTKWIPIHGASLSLSLWLCLSVSAVLRLMLSQEGWNCPQCTYLNAASATACAMCETVRKVDDWSLSGDKKKHRRKHVRVSSTPPVEYTVRPQEL
jgi:hypothetical protein